MKPIASAFVLAVVCVCVPNADARQLRSTDPELTVVSTAPEGEVASLAEANEIRVVFSEPMVSLGRIPTDVQPSFFKISPAVPGAFRWSGTTILIFTPDPKHPLAYATTYHVTIAAGTPSASGHQLARAMTFAFTTPTVRLLQTRWYRQGGSVSGRMVVVLRFNQPIRPRDIAASLSAALEPHSFVPPMFSGDEQARLAAIDPDGMRRFDAKVNATKAIAASSSSVSLHLASDWDKKTYPPASDLVVFETDTPVQPESWVKLTLNDKLRSPAGPATLGKTQSFTIHAERAFFIDGFYCHSACDPERWNPIQMRSPVKVTDFAAAATARDVTGNPTDVPRAPQPKPSADVFTRDASHSITLEDAGFAAQLPLKKYVVAVRSDLHSSDGQVLGYPWVGVVDNWHRSAFTSFGDGHGVWEKDGGTTLPFYARNFLDVRQWGMRIEPGQLMATLLSLQESAFHTRPAGEGVNRRLPLTPDRIQSHGFDLSSALGSARTGIVWTAVGEGQPIPQSRRAGGENEKPQIRAYALAFENGLDPASVLPDVPSHFPTAEAGVLYSPRNYDGRYRGPLLARRALAGSENVPAVALTSELGVPNLLRLLGRAGLTTFDRTASYYGLGVTLGNAEVRLDELVAGYSAFARAGEWIAPSYQMNGPSSERRSLVSPRTAFWISDILSDADAREYVFDRGGSLEFPFPVAAKTGTSQAYHDNWTIGYSRHVTVGVWVGNFDRKPLRNSSGVTGAGPIFHAVMLAAEKRAARRSGDQDIDPFEPIRSDAGARAQSVEICALSGLAANPWCPARRQEWIGAEAGIRQCSWHHLTDEGLLTVWPTEYRQWARDHGIDRAAPRTEQTVQTVADVAPRAKELRISSPPDGATYLIDPTLRREFQALSLRAVTSTPGPLQWSVDERSLGTSESDRAASWPLVPGRHTFRARDAAGLHAETTIVVR